MWVMGRERLGARVTDCIELHGSWAYPYFMMEWHTPGVLKCWVVVRSAEVLVFA